MTDWFVGPGGLPEALRDLIPAVEKTHGPAADQRGPKAGRHSVIVSVADPASGQEAVEWLNGLSKTRDANVVVIVGDGYLGTDVAERSVATLSAAAVSAARSLAAARGSRVRANVVCVPEWMVGASGEHRGPLALQPGPGDVIDAVLFFMDEENSYVSGQVLFVDGGRHLFSSHTS